MAEAPLVVLGDVRERLEQMDGGHDDVVEVQGVGLAQPRLVHPVRLGQRLVEASPGALGLAAPADLVGVALLVDQLVLEVRDLGAEGLRRELLGVEIEITADERHEPLGVGRVVDRERRGEAELLGLPAQDADAGAVEGHDPHGVGARADQLLDALLHLAGGLVGEGDRQYLAGVDAARPQQMGDPVREHAGLAGTGAGHDEQRRSGVDHGGALLFVQSVQQGGGVHDRARGAVAVVGVPGRGHVERALEEIVRDLLSGPVSGLLGVRRGLLRGVLEVRQEAVVKEAAHRSTSLGRGTDSSRPHCHTAVAARPEGRGDPAGAPGQRDAFDAVRPVRSTDAPNPARLRQHSAPFRTHCVISRACRPPDR